jgi:hypothetical protein
MFKHLKNGSLYGFRFALIPRLVGPQSSLKSESIHLYH